MRANRFTKRGRSLVHELHLRVSSL